MISTFASVPIWIPVGNNLNVIICDTAHPITAVVSGRSDWPVNEMNDVGDAQRKKKYMGLIRMAGSEGALAAIYLIYKLAFNGVYAIQWTVMEQRLFSFSVTPHLEPLHHFYVASA